MTRNLIVRRALICLGLMAALPMVGQISEPAAASPLSLTSPQAVASARMQPFLSQKPAQRAAKGKRSFHGAGSINPTLRGRADAGADVLSAGGSISSPRDLPDSTASPLTSPVSPDDLLSVAGIAQASAIHSFGTDQEVTPPNEDIAAGPNDLAEVVNSSIDVFDRAGAILASADLNTFMDVARGYHSSDPRVIFDVVTGRYWVTVTEVPNSGCAPAPVLIAVSASSNPLPFTGWRVYALPILESGTTFGDQPGLGSDESTIVVTFDDFNCSLQFLGSEVDILQKTDLETDTGAHQDDPFDGGPFAPQPVVAYNAQDDNYVLTNESDCGATVCADPVAEMDTFQGTPERPGGVYGPQQYFVPITPTAVNDTTGFLPPAAQPSPGPTLQTNDDRFLNAVETDFADIWVADGTSCEPPGDTVQRACLNYLEIALGPSNPTLAAQVTNVGVDGADLYYPAVAIDDSGNMITVFDESSSTMNPSIMAADIPMGSSTLTTFETLHTSSTYYDGDALFPGACDAEGCRWGDYSGAAQDLAGNGEDVWVVSGSEDNTVEGACAAHACWNTRIDQLTLSGPVMNEVAPALVPLTGGTPITVTGRDFAADTTLSITDDSTTAAAPIDILSPRSFTFVAPPTFSTSPTGGPVFITATDSLGSDSSGYTYVGLANYVPVTPFRILDTRTSGGGGPLGPGETRFLQVSGTGSPPLPQTATAYVLNVTAVNGTAASLLTVYSGQSKPSVSNLNFAAHSVVANLVTVTTGGSGQILIYNALGSVNVLVDVEGYFAPEASTDFDGRFHPITPFRVCDTRRPSPTPACSAHGAMGPATALVVDVTGGSGIPNNGTAGAAVVNLTGVAGSASTFLSLFPTDSTGGCQYTGSNGPPFSMINLLAGAVVANRVMVELGPGVSGGPDTSLCVYNAAGNINVVIDANGWYGSSSATASPAGYQYQAVEPTRICDTRVSTTFCLPAGAIGAALSRRVPVAGDSFIPAISSSTTVEAVIANLTGVAPSAATFLTLYPANLTGRPQASDLNLSAGEVLANLAVVQLDTTGDANDGDVSLYNGAGSVNAIIDIEGWFQ